MKRFNRTIQFLFYNNYTKQDCFKLTEPYQAGKSYSKIYKKFRKVIAENEGVEEKTIIVTHTLSKENNHERTIFEWPGGFKLDMPFDASPYDYSIVKAQLDVIKMSRSR